MVPVQERRSELDIKERVAQCSVGVRVSGEVLGFEPI